MARFEQRITDEQVAAARREIAAGASLRFAAAEVPCAPSTLSDRIKKAEAVEADQLARAGIDKSGGGRRVRRTGKAPEGAVSDDTPGPVEVLRGALLAIRANGQPDWPTRVTAARALATLRPELVEPPAEREPAVARVVYDLAPGSAPVLHRPQPVTGGEGDDIPTPPEQLLEPGMYVFSDGDRMVSLADVDLVAGEGAIVRFLSSREDAFDVFRAVGGNLASLETILAADPGAKTT
jgi:hypothetical protein